MSNKTPNPTSQFISTQYDFDLNANFILHVTAESLEAATERVDHFLHRLREEEAKGKAERFLKAHDAVDVPLAFFLRNRAAQNVSCWLTQFEQEPTKRIHQKQYEGNPLSESRRQINALNHHKNQ